MQVSEVMTQGVECVNPRTTVREAAQKMRDLDIGPLPICGDNDRLVGMITDRDIVIRTVAEGLDPEQTRVSDVMTPDIIWCFEDQDVTDAAWLMEGHQIRRLVVLNRAMRLVGIVSLGDLAVDTRDEHLVGHALEAVSEPAEPRR